MYFVVCCSLDGEWQDPIYEIRFSTNSRVTGYWANESLRSASLPATQRWGASKSTKTKVVCNLGFYGRNQPLCIVLSFMCSLILDENSHTLVLPCRLFSGEKHPLLLFDNASLTPSTSSGYALLCID